MLKIAATSLTLALGAFVATGSLSTADARSGAKNFSQSAGKYHAKRHKAHRRHTAAKRRSFAYKYGDPRDRRWDGYRFSNPLYFW